MTIRNKFVKTLEILLSNGNNINKSKKAIQYGAYLNRFTDKDEKFQKIKELESLVYGLSAKVTVLTDKVSQLNEQIINLTTLNEELLYALDSNNELQEDNDAPVSLNSKMKKFELN